MAVLQQQAERGATVVTVVRLVTKARRATFEEAEAFYNGILHVDVAVNQNWIVSFDEAGRMASEPATAPVLAIEVDNLDLVLKRLAKHNIPLVSDPVVDATGLRSFQIEDPFGRMLKIIGRT